MTTDELGPTKVVVMAGQAQSRERQIAELFDAHYPSLRGLAYVILGDAGAAEEIASEVFVKAFTGWNRFRTVDHPASYLRRMTVNQCRSRLRRSGLERRTNQILRRTEDVMVPDADERLDLWNAVRQLPERQRLCIVLRYLEDLPEAQIAAVMECSAGTVKSQLHRARKSLGKLLETDTEAGERR